MISRVGLSSCRSEIDKLDNFHRIREHTHLRLTHQQMHMLGLSEFPSTRLTTNVRNQLHANSTFCPPPTTRKPHFRHRHIRIPRQPKPKKTPLFQRKQPNIPEVNLSPL